ncbi:MAG TPA: hypothetical protein PLA24_09700 [Tenuifilaceae bacterium]|nr:hypothetical protein [Tenuifilaceae bacterium]
MKYKIAIVLCALVLSFTSYAGEEEDALKQSIGAIANDLLAKHSGSSKVKIAILQFRTNNNKLTPFNAYIQDELVLNYQNSKRFEVIDQNAINIITEDYGWNLDNCTNFKSYSELSENIFRGLGLIPEAFIYGQIKDNGETITITGYIVPNGVKSTNISSTQVVKSSALTDKLLGKPIRQPKEEPKVVVVEKPVVVENQVVVEKPVYVEKEVVVEKPVYVENNDKKPNTNKYAQNIGDLEFEMTEVKYKGDKVEVTLKVVNNNADDKIDHMESRFIDDQGMEFKSSYYQNTFKDRELVEKVPIKGTITFYGDDNINRSKSMAVIEIKVYGIGNGNLLGTLRFRDVPIER